MREIKFRFWLKNIKEYVYWEKFKDLLNDQLYDYFNSKNIEVEQFTGLKDKNSKEIYEGDIVEINYEIMWGWSEPFEDITVKRVVEYIDSSFVIDEVCYLDGVNQKNIEVIGNIHDNPELLKGNNNET